MKIYPRVIHPIINHTYKVKYQEVNGFVFDKKNKYVGLDTYEPKIYSRLATVVQNLLFKDKSRQEVIVVHVTGIDIACLISLQFQLIDKLLYVTANYRSQCSKYGRPYDELMILQVTSDIMRLLGDQAKYVDITVNVANYHTRLD